MKRQCSSSSLPRKMSLRSFTRNTKCICEMKPSKFSVSFWDLQYQDLPSTYTVLTEDGDQLEVYFLLLSAISEPMWKTCLESMERKIEIKLPTDLLKSIINLAYTGECEFRSEDLFEMMTAAKKFKIGYLSYLCQERCTSILSPAKELVLYRKSVHSLCIHFTKKIKKFRNLSEQIALAEFQVNFN